MATSMSQGGVSRSVGANPGTPQARDIQELINRKIHGGKTPGGGSPSFLVACPLAKKAEFLSFSQKRNSVAVPLEIPTSQNYGGSSNTPTPPPVTPSSSASSTASISKSKAGGERKKSTSLISRDNSPVTNVPGDVSPRVAKDAMRSDGGGDNLVSSSQPISRSSLGTPSLLSNNASLRANVTATSSLKKSNSRAASPASSIPNSRASSPTLSNVVRPDSPIFYKNEKHVPPLTDFSGYVVEKDPMVKVKINGIEYGRRPSVADARKNGAMGAHFNNGSSLTFNTSPSLQPSLSDKTEAKSGKTTSHKNVRKRSSKGGTKTEENPTQDVRQNCASSQLNNDLSLKVASNQAKGKPLDLSTKPKRQNRNSRTKTKKEETVDDVSKQPKQQPQQLPPQSKLQSQSKPRAQKSRQPQTKPKHPQSPDPPFHEPYIMSADGFSNVTDESRKVNEPDILEGTNSSTASNPHRSTTALSQSSAPVTSPSSHCSPVMADSVPVPIPSSQTVDPSKLLAGDVSSQYESSPDLDVESCPPPLISDSTKASLSSYRFGKDSSCPTCHEMGAQGKLKFCFVSFEEGVWLCSTEGCPFPISLEVESYAVRKDLDEFVGGKRKN